MGEKNLAIHWFRNDLRVTDNPAFNSACEYQKTIAIYIFDIRAPNYAQLGSASKWWLHQSLKSLSDKLNGRLFVVKGDADEIIETLVDRFSADAVFWNRQYEDWQIARDKKIKANLQNKGIQAVSRNGQMLWEPMSVLKKDGSPYKVFTPYYRKGCLNKADPRLPMPKPKTTRLIEPDLDSHVSIDSLDLLPAIPWDKPFYELWDVSEEGAHSKLTQFLDNQCSTYESDRNIPSIIGTSRLSPYLHFGQISANQIWYAVKNRFADSMMSKSVDIFLSELGWREFSYYLLFHFPKIPTENFNKKFDSFVWRDDPDRLIDWQKGNTGIPIVDAGMRELYQTGYMHNRVRMIVGSFLVKNLLIDWREGERWFWDCLLDADLAANSASWQWVAGSGADAAPYFRIFNPVLQGEKFDKEGVYVRKFCPELSKLPNKYVHKPWDAPDELMEDIGLSLGFDYPAPIVDLKMSRQRALDAFAKIKTSV